MKPFFEISEHDIFNYVFYPDQVSRDKKDFLDQHRNDFLEQLEFCSFLKQINSTVQKSNFISGKSNVVELFPVVINIPDQNNYFTLAAGSSELSKKIETKTFTDNHSRFLVRLVSTIDEKTLYVFTKEKTFKEAKLTLFPSHKSYKIDPTESSIKIDDFEEVESISIEDIN